MDVVMDEWVAEKKNAALLNPNLDAFMAVAEQQSVHAAARSIHLSQTALTQRIQALERKLGTTLFVRTRQGMQLTAEGEHLLRYCHTVNQYSMETIANLMNAGAEIPLRAKISGPSSIMIARIIQQCMPVMQKFPQLYLDFDVDDTSDILKSLRMGLSQFAILAPEQLSDDMSSKKLQPDRYLLVCSRQWKKRSLTEIISKERIIDFSAQDHMTFNYLEHHDLLHLARPERLFVNRTGSVATLMINQFGYGVLTQEFAQPYLNSGELIVLNDTKSYDYSQALAWYPRPELPHYFEAIIKAII